VRVIDLHLLFESYKECYLGCYRELCGGFLTRLALTCRVKYEQNFWLIRVVSFFIILKNRKPFECIHITVAIVSFV